MKLLNFQMLCFMVFVTNNAVEHSGIKPRSVEDEHQYGSCTMNIWNTNEMKADDYPSILAIIQRESDKKTPTYHLPLFKSSDRVLQIEFKHGEKLIFICHADTENVDEQTITCYNGHKDPDIDIIEGCKTSEPKPELLDMKMPCGGNAKNHLYSIGYRVYPKYSTERYLNGDISTMTNVYFPFIQVCLDPVSKITLYTSHNINGRVIAARQILSFIPDEFSMEGYAVIDKKFTTEIDKSLSLRKIYRPQKQFHYLYTLFEKTLREYFDNEDSNFKPRQLTPDYDMLLKNYKTLTHYYINTVPVWSIISCTWDALEELIRERAAKRNAELTIYTGTYGILTLDGVEVFLSKEKLTVSKYLWKIILQRKTGAYSAIGFITSNNPYDTEKETFCESVCRSKGWPIDVKTPGLGRTVCCTVKELLSKMEIKISIPKINGSQEVMDLSEIEDVLTIPA